MHHTTHTLAARPRAGLRAALGAAAFACAWVAPAAQAQLNVSFTPSAGQLNYTVEPQGRFQWSGSARQVGIAFDTTLPTGWYFGLSHASTNGGEVDFDRGGPVLMRGIGFRRSDSALTFGHAVFEDLNAFAGVRSSTSRLDNGIDTRFSTTGYFAGLGYPLALGRATLALSVAFGMNTGKWSDTSGSVSDTASGFSAGARLSYPLGRQMQAGLGLKAQRYSYDFTTFGLGTVEESLRVGEAFISISF
jgi:hypothetical protein